MVNRDARNLLDARNWRTMARHRDGWQTMTEKDKVRIRVKEP